MLIKTIASKYPIKLSLSAVLAIVIIALRVETDITNIMAIIGGCLLGTFLLDMDFLIFAFVVEPKHHFSIRVRELAHQRNFDGIINYIFLHKTDIPRLALSSALFQTILAMVTFYVLTSSTSVFTKAFVLSGFGQSIYELMERYQERKGVDEWFWILKEKPERKGVKIYLAGMLVLFLYSLLFVR